MQRLTLLERSMQTINAYMDSIKLQQRIDSIGKALPRLSNTTTQLSHIGTQVLEQSNKIESNAVRILRLEQSLEFNQMSSIKSQFADRKQMNERIQKLEQDLGQLITTLPK